MVASTIARVTDFVSSQRPKGCFGKNVVIVSCIGFYVTFALIVKTRLLPKDKVWIGFPTIVAHVK